MVSCTVKNWQGESAGEATLNLTGAKAETAPYILHRAVIRQLNNARQGTASAKTRAEVRGGGRKPWRQKGTGRARAGSNRSPLWRGGGVVFGPKPRDFSVKMNRKERRLALRTALLSRAEDFVVVESFVDQFPQPKTKEFVSALTRWGVDVNHKILLVLPEFPENLFLSVRNIANVKLLRADSINVYDILNADTILTTPSALAQIQEIYHDDK